MCSKNEAAQQSRVLRATHVERRIRAGGVSIYRSFEGFLISNQHCMSAVRLRVDPQHRVAIRVGEDDLILQAWLQGLGAERGVDLAIVLQDTPHTITYCRGFDNVQCIILKIL